MGKTHSRVTVRLDQHQHRLLHRAASRLDLSTSETLRVAVVMIEEASRAHKRQVMDVYKNQVATWDDGRFKSRGAN